MLQCHKCSIHFGKTTHHTKSTWVHILIGILFLYFMPDACLPLLAHFFRLAKWTSQKLCVCRQAVLRVILWYQVSTVNMRMSYISILTYNIKNSFSNNNSLWNVCTTMLNNRVECSFLKFHTQNVLWTQIFVTLVSAWNQWQHNAHLLCMHHCILPLALDIICWWMFLETFNRAQVEKLQIFHEDGSWIRGPVLVLIPVPHETSREEPPCYRTTRQRILRIILSK